MKLQLIAAVFVLTAILMLGILYLDEGWFAGMALGFTLSGIAVAIGLAMRGYVYSSVLLGYHVLMAAFTAWVFVNRELVVRTSEFRFSTFTDANLQWAMVTLVTASLVVFLCWVVLARGARNFLGTSAASLVYELLGRMDRVPLAGFQIALGGSFILAVLFFMTNTSVLDVPYPFQGRTQWVPWEIQKIPLLLAVGALAFGYARCVRRRRSFGAWLLIGRLNFLIVGGLMLSLMGSRGMVTFFVLGFGVFELVLWRKRRGSLAWGLLFVASAWFAYQSWPYMRNSLSSLPADEVAAEALRIGLGLGGDAAIVYADEAKIRLGDITMISASLFHLLYVIQLVQDGISLGGSSFVNLISQSLPSWLDGVLWERPLNDNLRLGDYYYHGGGFLILANAYWNGGLRVALAFMAALSAIFVGFDRYLMRPDVGLLYRTVYWLWLPVTIVQLGYGMQGMVRVLELLVAVILLERFLLRRRVRARRNRLGRVAASRPAPDRFIGDQDK